MKKKPANTLADFKAAHDPSTRFANKVREGLKSLAAEGKEAWEHEGEFIRRCGVATHQLTKYRDQFSDFWVDLPRSSSNQKKRAWFGDKRVAAKARG